ncbi:MAG: LptF/LptG family permease [Candidatus Didemnitutus sp.]|nr:LptF/LptG family permease [Candidatus Didemnitutus sp.]
MTLFDRYLLREWLKILGLLLCATMGLLVMQALYDNFRDLIEVGAGMGEMLAYYAVLMPSYLSVVLPIALLLSLLFVLGKLHRHNEITAIRAAGLNIFSTTRALWGASLVFCGVSLFLNARVVPWSVETSRTMLERFEYRAEEQKGSRGSLGLVTSVAFDNQRAKRMWYINRYSRFAEKAYGVTVSELGRELTRLMAREATYNRAAQQWTFRDGREMWFDPENGELMRSVAFTTKTIPHLNEDPELMLLIDRRPRDLSFFELQRIVDYFTLEDNPKVTRYAVRYYGLLADTFGPLIILAIAIPFAVAGVRVSPVVGVSKSIGLFFGYYLLTTIMTLLGGKGFLDPIWAAFAPNLAMIALATFFFGRMR